MSLATLIARQLRDTADKIEAGTCSLSEQEALDILKVIAHETLSKDQACGYLNISRATFDNKVRDGIIPEGRKIRGFKELVWFKDEIISNVLNR